MDFARICRRVVGFEGLAYTPPIRRAVVCYFDGVELPGYALSPLVAWFGKSVPK